MLARGERIAAGLGIRSDEVERLQAVLLCSLLLGASLELYYTAANAIYLAHEGVGGLPDVYIANGLVVVLFGIAYAALGRRLRFARLTFVVSGFLALTIVAVWLGVHLSPGRPAAFVMMMWFRLLFIYTTLGLWELVSRLFEVRQGKRLFALVGLGVMIGVAASGLLSPLVVALVGTPNLLLVSAGLLGLYALSLRGILGVAGDVRQHKARRVGVGAMLADPYARTIFGLKTFSVLTAYIVEYVFYQQAAAHFPLERTLAGFLGTFSGGTTLAMIVVAAVVAGRLIARRGVGDALALMPVAMVVAALGTLIVGALTDRGGLFFALVAGTMFINQVLEKAIYTPVLVVLFQPMARERRLPVRVAVEGWLGSAALIGCGFVLLAIGAIGRGSMLPFVALLVAVALVFLVLARRAFAQYRRALIESTARRPDTAHRLLQAGVPAAPRGRTRARRQLAASAAASRGRAKEPALTDHVPIPARPGPPLALGTTAWHELAEPTMPPPAPAPYGATGAALGEDELRVLVEFQVERARALLAAKADLDGQWPLLGSSLAEDLEDVRSELFSLLCCSSLIVGCMIRDIVRDAESRVRWGDADDRANAVELLDLLFPEWLKRPVITLSEDRKPEQAVHALTGRRHINLEPAARVAALRATDAAGSFSRRLLDQVGPRGDEPGRTAPSPGAAAKDDVSTVVWLRSLEMFARLPYAVLSELAGAMRTVRLAPGDVLVRRGESLNELYLVCAGELARDDGTGAVAPLGAHAAIGELAVLEPEIQDAALRARSACELLVLDGRVLADVLTRQPDLALSLVPVLVRRLRRPDQA